MALPSGYCDFNLRWHSSDSDVIFELIEAAVELGYESVVVNNFVESLQGGKGKKKNEKIHIAPHSEILLNEKSVAAIKQSKGKSFEQFSRLTTLLQDASNTYRLNNSDVQNYDLIAVQPTDEKTFQLACKTLEVDIICLNFTENLGFSLKRQLLNLAASRGIYFEIIYSPALTSNQLKRNVISNALSLVTASCGKNIILSSGADKPIDLRSPYDVINLGRLFGLSHSQAKDAICKNCRAITLHAKSRKSCKSVIFAQPISSVESNKKWIIKSKINDLIDEENTPDSQPKMKKVRLL